MSKSKNVKYFVQIEENGKVFSQVWIGDEQSQPDSYNSYIHKQGRILRKIALDAGEENFTIKELEARYFEELKERYQR